MEAKQRSSPPERRAPGLHGAWSRFGFPPTYLGKWLVLALLVVGGPVIAAGLLAPADLLRPALWSALAGGAVLFVLLGSGLVRPLDRADEALGRVFESSEPGPSRRRDVAARLVSSAVVFEEQSELRAGFLADLAGQDYVTGLPNRASAVERLRQNRSLAERDHLPLTTALVDVTSWSENEEPAATRELMAGVARVVDQQLRGSDWAARWSEDQLLLVLFASVDGADRALRRLVADLLGLRVVVGERSLAWRGVVGAAQLRSGESFADWLQRLRVAHGAAHGSDAGLVIHD